MDTKSVTIMKYKTPNNEYKFEVLDRFDVADPAERLDAMIEKKRNYLLDGTASEVLWIKETVLF